MKPGKFILLALISVSVLLTTGLRADVAADVAALKNLEIGKLCPLFIETPLVRAGEVLAAIVPATGEPWTSAATKLQSGIAGKTGVTLPIVPAEKITDADWSSRNLIVLGNLIASPVYAHEATVALIADLDGDGLPEIVAGNNYYSLQILNNRGKVVGNYGSIGPEQTDVTSIALPVPGQRAVILGFDDGEVMAFDASGKRRWNVNTGAPAKCLVRNGNFYFAATAHGIVRLSLDGAFLGILPTSSPAVDLVSGDGEVFALLSGGSVICVRSDLL